MGSTSVVRARADWVGIVESTVADEPDDRRWGEAIVDAMRGALPRAAMLALTVFEGERPTSASVLTVAPGWPDLVQAHEELTRAPASVFEAFLRPPVPVLTQREILRSSSNDVAEFLHDAGHLARVADTLGLVVRPKPDLSVVVWAVHDREIALSRYDRRLLTQVAMHLEAGYRARKVPGAVKAVLDTTGRVIERADDAPPTSLLEEHGARLSLARSAAARKSADAIDLWPALLQGKLGLVPRGSPTRRRYEVVENAPTSIAVRALSSGERAVLDHCARGLSVKAVAYALGLAPGTVSTRLGHAAAKLGVASRLELLRVAALLTGDRSASLPDDELSAAEREVLDLLERGLSNREIARLRSRSTRTIANQVASLLRKTRSTSRRELLARGVGGRRASATAPHPEGAGHV